MDENLNFNHLNIRGDIWTNDVLSKDSYFYFMGIDNQIGKQVYRVQVYSERVGNNEMLISKDNFIYPNPCQDKINFSFTPNHSSYLVYNSLGQIVKSGNMIDNSISTNELNNGVFYLKFKDSTPALKFLINR